MADGPEDLRYLAPAHAAVNGLRCENMIVRSATGDVIGRLQGFVVDPVARRLRYFVVRSGGLGGIFGGARLLPLTAARINLRERAIELLDAAHDLGPARRFPSFSDYDLVTAMFAPRA